MATEPIARSTHTKTSGNGLDFGLAIALTGAGALAFSHRAVGMLDPDLLGSATASVLAVVLVLAARLPYRSIVATGLGIVLIQLAASIAARIPPTALIGYPLVALGLVGLPKTIVSVRKTSAYQESAPQQTARKPLPAAGQTRTKGAMGHRLAAG
jgi:hypothetical protein